MKEGARLQGGGGVIGRELSMQVETRVRERAWRQRPGGRERLMEGAKGEGGGMETEAWVKEVAFCKGTRMKGEGYK